MKKYVLAFDAGTASSRAILFDHAGKIVSVAQQEFPQVYLHGFHRLPEGFPDNP